MRELLPIATSMPNWMCWKGIPQPDGKVKKLPITPRTGKPADPSSISDHTDYDTAVAYAAANGLQIAFVFTPGCGLFFVDVDDCLTPDNRWSDMAQELLNRLPGAFVEVSQSGRGLHIIGSGDKPAELKCKSAAGFDIYPGKGVRFIALTGAQASGCDAAQLQDEISAISYQYIDPDTVARAPEEWTDSPREGWSGPEDDEALIVLALKSRSMKPPTFKHLWERDEDVLGEAYPDDQGTKPFDHNRADAALVQHLAFWTGCDCDRIDRLFRTSDLMRDKWEDRDDYRTNTILRAVGLQKEVYRDARQAQAASVLPAASAPALSAPTIEPFSALPTQAMPGLTGDHLLDALQIMRDHFKNRLCLMDGAPHWWTGAMWEPVPDEGLRKHIGMACAGGVKVTSARIAGTLSVFKDQIPHMVGANSERGSVFFTNGAYRRGVLKPHAQIHKNTRNLPIAYIPDAPAPELWLQWVSDLFADEPDRILLLQEIMGWAMCGDTLGIEKAVLFIGPTRAGKGVIIKVLRALLGSAATSCIFGSLADDKQLASMRSSNIAIDSDAVAPDRHSAKAVVGVFNKLTANEPVTIKLLYQQQPWQAPLNCKLLLAANRIPAMFDDSAAAANRWIPLVFTKSFLGHEDPFLAGRLLEELPSIALWAIEGLERLKTTRRFTLPESSLDKLDALVTHGSPLTEFVEDSLTVGVDERASDEQLWSSYVAWAARSGVRIMTRRDMLPALADALQGKGVQRKKTLRVDGKDVRGFRGVSVVPAAVADNVVNMR